MDNPVEVNANANRKCAEMVHIKSPNNFWIRLEEYKNDYIEMLAQLQSQYQDAHEDCESLNISDVKLGSTYCSFNHILFEWHRCEILAVNMTDVYISYIDIGHTDLVPVKSIKNLKSHFQIHSPFALHCTLNGIKPYDTCSWSLEVVNEFTKITNKKLLTLNIKSKIDNVYHIDLFVKNINISEHLVKLNYAVQIAESVSVNSNSVINKIKVESGKEYLVTVPSIVNPFCFYVQINEYLEEFGKFEVEMQEYYQNVPIEGQQLENPQIGALCMAKYTEDQQWYRAKVKEINKETKTFRVYFIDYGNEDIIPQAGLLRIEPKFLKYPIMAIKCCLDGIKPPNEGFLESKLSEVADFMYNSLMESVMCIFTGRKIDDFHLVSVNVQDQTLSKILIENSYASKIENSPLKKIPIPKQQIQNKIYTSDGLKKYLNENLNLELNKIYEVVVTHIETFREFYIKLQETDLIKNSMNNMKYFYEKKINLPQPLFEPDSPCVYYDYDNKDWLRAKIIHIYDDNHCLIRLVDSGRTKYVNRRELREIFDKFLEQQCQGALACLDGLSDFNDEDIDEGILLKFKEIALNKKFIAKVIKVDKKMSKFTLNLFDESGESVYHVLVDNLDNSVLNLSQKFKPTIQSKLEETQISMLETSLNDTVVKPSVEIKKSRICEYYYYESLKIHSELKYTINISNYESKNKFYAQINSEFEIFDAKFDEFQQSCELANKIDLNDLTSLSDLSKLAVGARFYDDNLWYRAKIIAQPLNNIIKVEFVDYGNIQDTKIEDLVYLTSLYAKFPPSTLKIDSIAYIDEINIADDILQKTLLYGDSETEENKYNWQNAFFRLSSLRNEIIIDDFYALLYKNNILKSDFYIKPAINDPISSLNNDLEIKSSDILSVRLCNIENGLKYIYFNLISSLERLNKMESLIEPLIKLEQENIKMNQIFLVKSKKNKLFRCVLLAKKSKKENIVFYVDYGRREILSSDIQCFIMPPSLYSFGLFGFHCRLTLADNIENVWTREEKEKFYQKIKPGHEYEIKLITRIKEPFIIEFYDKKNQIDFQFNQIISRMTQTKYETQSILNGIKIPNGDYHFLNHTESLDSDFFKIYIQSDSLFENLVEFTEKMTENLKANVNELKIKTIKKGDVFLSRTRNSKFLANIKSEKIRNFISKYYCRIFIEEKKNYLQIFYIDFGYQDIIPFENEILSNDYKMLTIPLQFKIIPQFLLEVKPSKLDYIKKLNNAVKFNDFIDSDFINSNLKEISSLIFKIDFSQAFYSSTEPIFQVDLVEKDGKNQNLIDLLIEKTFTNLTNYNFETTISHLNSAEDFYVQKIKFDSLLKDLQEIIQYKIQNKKLQRLKSIETNKLCVSGFEDGCFYRARIIGFGHKLMNSDEIVCDVFYIDYGNTSTVRTSELYELTPDLMDRFPKNFAINCRIDFNYCPNKDELEFINEFLFEIFESRKFDAKFKNRISDNKYNEAGFYLIDLFDSETKENVIDMFKIKALKEVQGQLSCVQFNGTMSDSIEEDKAIAESLNDDTVANATNLHESICMTKKEQDKFHQKLSDTWETTALELKNYEKFNDTLSEKEVFKKQLNDTWETTAIDLKNYDQYNETLNQTLTNKQDESIDKSELYSTANSSQFDSTDKTISEMDNQDDYLLIKDCLISFMHSTTDLFIQESNFDENIQKIQPLIDNCLDPFDLSESNLCIGQFQQDELFYRCKVLQWFEEKNEAFCELIDFGNRDYIPIDTITKMSTDLTKIKPLAINCTLNFDIEFESKAYQQLDDLVNLETKFDCRLKKSDLDSFYELPEQRVSIELLIPKNGLKITTKVLEEPCLREKINEEISQNEFDNYYQIKNLNLSPCKTDNLKKSRKDEDEDKDEGEPFSGSPNLNFKTSTKLNMAQKNDNNNCNKQSEKDAEKTSDIHFYVNEESVNLDRTDIHPKNTTVSYLEETRWSQNGSLLEDTQNHPKNETVNNMEETKWSQNGSLLEDTQNHPKNETVNNMEETKWSQNGSLLEDTQNHPKNETVNSFEDTKWSKNESVLEQSEFKDKNKTVSHFDETKWSDNDNTLDDNQNETVSQMQESRWSLNETEVNYICRSINENNESVWLDDPDESGFVYKEHIKQTRSSLDATRNEELPEYTQVITGNVIHVNSIDNFYFQREDADLKLMNMKNLIEKCSKKFDKIPRIGDLCITRYRVDEQLYRAQIIDVKPSLLNVNQSMNSTLKVTDQKVKIRYLDYGNEDYVYVSELFKCDPELKSIEPLALKCELNLDKKLKILIQKLNELEKDTTEIVKYFKMLTGRSKVTIKILKLINVDLKINKVDLFINQDNICDLLLNEALACLTLDTKKSDCKIKIGVPISEFFTNVINIKNLEFEKIIKVKNLNVLDKIDELIDSLVNQSVDNEENFKPSQQCLGQVPQDLMEKYKLNNPLSRVFILSHLKSDKYECSFIDFDHKVSLTKSNLLSSNHFINKIQSAVDKYELNLKNSELISSLTNEQKIQLQEIFKNLMNYETNCSSKLKACLIKPKTIRLFDVEKENLDLNTILELSINLMCNPFTGRVTHFESDYSQFSVLNELASNEYYKKEMKKIYISTGLFDFQCNSDDFDVKIGDLCLIDSSSSSNKYIQSCDSIMSLAEHCIEDEQVYELSKEISRALIMDEIEDKCVVLNLDTGKQLTLKKTRIRLLLGDICSVLYKIPFMLIKCKVMSQVDRYSSTYQQIHKSRFYGNSIKVTVLDTWNHEFDIKGLHKIVKINNSDHDFSPKSQSKNHSIYYMLSHVNSLNNFYIHPHDYENQLKFIQDQIEIEIEQKKSEKNPPELGKIYAIKEKNDFHRILLMNSYTSSNPECESFQAFYIDFGHMKKVYVTEIISISETIQSIAPQAICCKLNGFDKDSNKNQNFLDASESFNDSDQFNDNFYVESFKKMLKNEKFQASIYKQWLISKKIINLVPLQSDNLKPIEIVVHLDNQNLTDLLKNLKFKNLKASTKLETQFESEFQILNLVSPNEIWICLSKNTNFYTKINQELSQNQLAAFSENQVHPGLPCVKKINNFYKRAVILDSCKIKSELNIRLFLIDYGEIIFSGIEEIFKLPDKLYDIEPLAIKISLDLCMADKQTENSSTKKLKSLIQEIDTLRFRVLDCRKDYYTVKILNLNVQMGFFLDSLKQNLEEKQIIYGQVKLPLNQPLKVLLTNIDTAKHFGIVCSSNYEKRVEFISKFHQWHKENKKSLNSLSEDLLGKPCALSSIQIGKWCRGLVVQSDLTAQMSNVYLIDFCKTLTVTNDRLYKIVQEEFLSEPSYVHRCFLQEEQEQLQRFSKYIDMLKSSGMDPNTNLISIDNLEIQIEVLEKILTPLHVQSDIKNYQYKIKVLDIKRVKSPLPQSPQSILNNSAKIKLCHKQVKYSNSFYDETTENILCSTYKENYMINNQSESMTMIQSEHKNNDYQSDTFSAITESTRIQTLHDTDNMTLCESRRREETSNWIKDLDENEEEKILMIYSNLDCDQKSVRVRVLPYGFSPSEFLCQRLELKNSYEKLQTVMNDYYQKIINASKSLERDKINSMRSDFSDSLEISTDLFTNSFNRGEYCAAFLGKAWARCLILDIDLKTAMVECVDDGRKQQINLNKMEKLSDNFKVMPRYCFKCKFSGIDSKKLLSLDLKEIENFEHFLCDPNKELTVDIVGVKTEEITGQNIYEINLFMNEQNVFELWQRSEGL